MSGKSNIKIVKNDSISDLQGVENCETSTPEKEFKLNISSLINDSQDRTNIELFYTSETSGKESLTELEATKTEQALDRVKLLVARKAYIKTNMTELEQEMKIMNRLFTSLKIPDVIKDLQEFHGDIETLHQFIQNVDDIIAICETQLPECESIPVSFIKAIKNKIKGDANKVLINHNNGNDWDEIKQSLINHYSDKRSEVALIRDLHRLRQGNDSTEQFHSKILKIQTALLNQVRLKNEETTTKEELFKEMCLAQFLSNLQEPLGSNIRARDPTTLSAALELCTIEENMYYIKVSQYRFQNPKTNYRFGYNRQLIPQNDQQFPSRPFQNYRNQIQPFQNGRQPPNFTPPKFTPQNFIPPQTYPQRQVRFNTQLPSNTQNQANPSFRKIPQHPYPAIKYENKNLYNSQTDQQETENADYDEEQLVPVEEEQEPLDYDYLPNLDEYYEKFFTEEASE